MIRRSTLSEKICDYETFINAYSKAKKKRKRGKTMRAMDKGKHGFRKMQEVIAGYCPSDFKIKVKECSSASETKENDDKGKCLVCWSQEIEEENQ